MRVSAAPFFVAPLTPLRTPQFPKGLGVLNKIAASKSFQLCAAPLIALRKDVEFQLAEYDPDSSGRSLAEVTFRGFDHHGKYNEAEHTSADLSKIDEASSLLKQWW